MKDSEFGELQKRRSETEARISIFKNGFLGSPLLSKGHENQSREVAWSVLVHNLWVIARAATRHRRGVSQGKLSAGRPAPQQTTRRSGDNKG
jgi:hypothetical protein